MRNFKAFLYAMALGYCTITANAQSKQFTGTVIVDTPLDRESGVFDVSYSYTVDNNGERIRNGAYTIKGKPNHNYSIGYGSLKQYGTYALSAMYKNDKLNGAMSVTANYTETGKMYGQVESHNYKYSLTGSFANGLPNGTFNVTSRNGGMPSYVKATFKNGVLVGAFSCDTYYDEGWTYKYTGTLTADGRLTGTWTKNTNGNYNKEVYTFLNGVLVSYSSKDKDTSPAEIALAKKYANKTITKDDLIAQGYAIVEDKFTLGKYVNNVILSGAIAPWGDKNGIDGYDFTTDNDKTFERLLKLNIADDAFVKRVAKVLALHIDDYDDYDVHTVTGTCNYNKTELKYGMFETKYGMYCTLLCGGGERYYSNEQMKIIDDAVDAEKQRRLKVKEDRIKRSATKLQFVFDEISKASTEFMANPNKYIIPYTSSLYDISPLLDNLFTNTEYNEKELEHYICDIPNVSWANKTGDRKKLSDVITENLFPITDFEIDTLSVEIVEGKEINECTIKYPCTATIYYDCWEGRKAGIQRISFIAYMDVKDGLKIQETFKFEQSKFQVVLDEKYALAQLQDSTKRNMNLITSISAGIAQDVDKAHKTYYNKYKQYQKTKIKYVGEAVEALNKLATIQNQCLNFIEIRKTIADKNTTITSKSAEFKDIAKSYATYFKTADLTWVPEASIDKLNNVIAIQDGCCEFIKTRKTIADKEATIIALGAKCKNILNAYKKYIKTTDLTWAPGVSTDKLLSVIDTQDKIIAILQSPNATEKDKTAKKLKDKSITSIINATK